MKKLVALLVLLGLGLAGVAYWLESQAEAKVLPVQRELVDRGQVIAKVSAVGRLVHHDLHFVTIDVSVGRVAEILPSAEVGSTVIKDQLLLRLDDQVAKARLKEAEAALIAAEAAKTQAEAKRDSALAGVGLAQAQKEFAEAEYQRALARKKQLNQVEFNRAEKALAEAKEGIKHAEALVKEAEAAIRTAESNIARAEAGVAVARFALDRLQVKSPCDGVILECKVTEGQLVTPQSTPVLFVIAPDLSKMDLRAQVAEADISKIRVGMEATFTVDAYADEEVEFAARVSKISSVPTVNAGERKGLAASLAGGVFYEAVLEVQVDKATRTHPLKTGMTANVDFIVRKSSDSLRIPSAALHYRPADLTPEEQELIDQRVSDGWQPIWIWQEGSKPRMVFIQTGASDANRTEVLKADGALEAGMEVIVKDLDQEEEDGFLSLKNVRLG